MKRGALLPLILVPGLAIPLMAPPALAAPLPQAQSIDWETCGEEESPDAECGTLTVPIDWDDPDGEAIDLALARIPANDPDARIGSLVINPGGPGGSGVGFALFAPEIFSPDILARFDVVGFDPRGVGDSHPVQCSLELLGEEPGSLFGSRADLDARTAFNEELREDCRENTGPLYDHVDSLSVVHDIDAIRAALGDEQLSFFGVSYGTLMGQQYAATYPERVRAVVLDSVMDHDLGTRDYLLTQAEAAQDSFDAFVAWCEDSTQCALNGQDPRALWTDLLKRADKGELGALSKLALGVAAYRSARFEEAERSLSVEHDLEETPSTRTEFGRREQALRLLFLCMAQCKCAHRPEADRSWRAAQKSVLDDVELSQRPELLALLREVEEVVRQGAAPAGS